MATAEQRNFARSYLKKAEEYAASAAANLAAERFTPTAGDSIHAGICAKDAIVTVLTGSTRKGADHAIAAKELRRALALDPLRRRRRRRCASCLRSRVMLSTAPT